MGWKGRFRFADINPVAISLISRGGLKLLRLLMFVRLAALSSLRQLASEGII